MSCGFMNEQKKSLKLNYGLQDVKPCKILNNTTGKYFLTHIKFSNFDLFFCRFEFYLIQEFVPSFYQIINSIVCLERCFCWIFCTKCLKEILLFIPCGTLKMFLKMGLSTTFYIYLKEKKQFLVN